MYGDSVMNTEATQLPLNGAPEPSGSTGPTRDVVRGVFRKKIFGGENYFCISVFDLVDEGEESIPTAIRSKGEFVAIGTRLPELDVFNIRFEGSWNRNEKRGGELQFKVAEFFPEEPHSAEGVIKVLSCGVYKGIGEKNARKIYDRFGKDSLRILREDTGRLREVKGIGSVVVNNIIEAVKEDLEYHNLIQLLAPYGISANRIRRIMKAFPENATDAIKEDPFVLCEIPGFGFKTVDDIAEKYGSPLNSPLRVQAAIEDVLKQNTNQGNLYEFYSEVMKAAIALLNNRPGEKVCEEAITAQLDLMRFESKVSFENVKRKSGEVDKLVYRRDDYRAETGAASRMAFLQNTTLREKLRFNDRQLQDEIVRAESEFNMQFAPKQKEAISAALSNKICVITGGPGTGKTTILRAILSIYKRNVARNFGNSENAPKSLLLSPTGKAARRMSESAREPAFTIHKGLGITPGDVGKYVSVDSMLSDDIGLVVIDEASMADMRIWDMLISEIPEEAQLVIIGDVDQLPSVGAGAVLYDMIGSGVIPVVRLDVIYRQGEESLIVTNSHRIKDGNTSLIYSGAEFKFFGFPGKAETGPDSEPDKVVQNKMIALFLRAIQTYSLKETLILCPRREKVACSAYVMNTCIQTELHGNNPHAKKFTARKKLFYVGDRIIQTANTEKASNGDMGTIVDARVDPEYAGSWIATIVFDYMEDGDFVEYSGDDFDNLQLGYCITIHKSQGSEAKAVFIPVLQSQIHMLKRNLIYTGVTRGKEFVALFGQEEALKMAIRKQDTTKRKTLFKARLQRKFKEVAN